MYCKKHIVGLTLFLSVFIAPVAMSNLSAGGVGSHGDQEQVAIRGHIRGGYYHNRPGRYYYNRPGRHYYHRPYRYHPRAYRYQYYDPYYYNYPARNGVYLRFRI